MSEASAITRRLDARRRAAEVVPAVILVGSILAGFAFGAASLLGAF